MRYRRNGIRAAAVCSAALMSAAILLSGCEKGADKLALRMSGIEKLDAGDYAGAVTDFEAAIQASRGRVGEFETDVLKYRAEAEYMLEDYPAAAHTYDVLVQVDGADTEYLYRAALMKALSGDAQGALSDYEEGVELEQKATGKKAAGKKADEKNGDKKPEPGQKTEETEASEDVDRFGRGDVLAAVGEACIAAGRREDADRLYEAAVQDGTAGPEVLNEMGLSLMEMGQYEEALGFFEQAVQSQSADASVREAAFNRGAALEYLGKYKDALQAFEEYVSQYGPDEAAQKEITFLKSR
ncbi:MAG: tetratricopeptide repeat protein [Lachnospiraceae bacterium]|nr:tetratricopeptide repeat protein [Lachnospiraceae bacterium]